MPDRAVEGYSDAVEGPTTYAANPFSPNSLSQLEEAFRPLELELELELEL